MAFKYATASQLEELAKLQDAWDVAEDRYAKRTQYEIAVRDMITFCNGTIFNTVYNTPLWRSNFFDPELYEILYSMMPGVVISSNHLQQIFITQACKPFNVSMAPFNTGGAPSEIADRNYALLISPDSMYRKNIESYAKIAPKFASAKKAARDNAYNHLIEARDNFRDFESFLIAQDDKRDVTLGNLESQAAVTKFKNVIADFLNTPAKIAAAVGAVIVFTGLVFYLFGTSITKKS